MRSNCCRETRGGEHSPRTKFDFSKKNKKGPTNKFLLQCSTQNEPGSIAFLIMAVRYYINVKSLKTFPSKLLVTTRKTSSKVVRTSGKPQVFRNDSVTWETRDLNTDDNHKFSRTMEQIETLHQSVEGEEGQL